VGSTTRYQWPYPEASDPPEPYQDIRALAGSLEETVGTLDDRLTTLDGLSQSVFQYTTLTRTSSNLQTIPNGAWRPLTWDTAQYNLPKSDPGFEFASPNRITCTQTGLYRLTGFAGMATNPNGSRAIAFRINANPSYPAISSGIPPADMPWYGSVICDARVNKTDFLELCLRQSSGGDLLMDDVFPRFGMQRLA
jgi:hypothetical protein